MVRRRPNLNFEEVQVPLGSVLYSVRKSEARAVVAGPREVTLEGEKMPLTMATQKVLGVSYHVSPCPEWQFCGRLLSDIYNETYPISPGG